MFASAGRGRFSQGQRDASDPTGGSTNSSKLCTLVTTPSLRMRAGGSAPRISSHGSAEEPPCKSGSRRVGSRRCAAPPDDGSAPVAAASSARSVASSSQMTSCSPWPSPHAMIHDVCALHLVSLLLLPLVGLGSAEACATVPITAPSSLRSAEVVVPLAAALASAIARIIAMSAGGGPSPFPNTTGGGTLMCGAQ
jgi:hypothetical protein